MIRRTKVFIVLGLIQAFFLSLVISAVGLLTMHQLGEEDKAEKKNKRSCKCKSADPQ
ncbi:MAG: hypothetical protein MR038_05845 [Oscillospiraceae bacterium]|nr:hypothetical protein [Oscillospiraceae bacterium]